MVPGVGLSRLLAEIGYFQGGKDCGVLADTAEIDFTSQPWPDRVSACLTGRDLTARSGKGTYRLRR